MVVNRRQLMSGVRVEAGRRADVDGAAYALGDDFYPPRCRRNQRSDLSLREAYVDVSAGRWDFHSGPQHVIWGENGWAVLCGSVSAAIRVSSSCPSSTSCGIANGGPNIFHGRHARIAVDSVAGNRHIGKPGGDFYGFIDGVELPDCG